MLRSFTVFLFALANIMAATPDIGQVSANGRLTINQSEVWGNATLFEGTTVATQNATGDLALRNGVRMQLGSQSQAVVSQDSVVLKKGSSQVTARDVYEVQARGLRITAEAGTRMLVALNSTNGVDVTALIGKARVHDNAGMLVAAIPQGRSAAFWIPQAGGTAVTRTGCLLYKDNHFILHDDATTEVIELSGSGFNPNAGNRVRITGIPGAGKPAVSIATGVLNVSDIVLQSTGGCITIAATLDARTEAPAASAAPSQPSAPASQPASQPASAKTEKHGMSGGAKAAIIIGVVGGGAGGAFAAMGGKKSSTSQ